MDRIWDVEGIEWNDIPSVHDLLLLADKKILAREYMDMRLQDFDAPGAKPSKKALKRARKRVSKLIEELRAIDPIEGEDVILFPKRSCAPMDGNWGWGCRVKCTAFERAKMDELIELGPQDKRFSELVAGVSILHQSWPEILGYKVWLGGDWCRRERYLFLADVLMELTFFGVSQKERDEIVEVEIKELEESAKSLRDPNGYIAYPAAVCFGSRGFASSDIYGLERSSDDYKSSHNDALRRVDMRIGSIFTDEMLANMKALGKKLERGYWCEPLAEGKSAKE